MEKPLESKKELPHEPTLDLEKSAWQLGFKRVAGVDEAGRGPLAGPVVVAAVVLGKDWNQDHPLDDSKRLSENQRDELFDIIKNESEAHKIIAISPEEIDRINILQATLLGMKQSVLEMEPQPDYALIDGNKYPEMDLDGKTVIKGDRISKSISAASILAKVTRDRLMLEYAKQFPEWGFEKHKGYPTKWHKEAIQKHGLSPIHRRSFKGKQARKTKTSATEQPRLL